MLAVGPLGPQYSLLFAWHELGSGLIIGKLPLPQSRQLVEPRGTILMSAKMYLVCSNYFFLIVYSNIDGTQSKYQYLHHHHGLLTVFLSKL